VKCCLADVGAALNKGSLMVFLFYHYEEHFEFCHCLEGVGFVGGHYGEFALFQLYGFACYGNFGFAFYNVD
jgi:hypothetical protein